MKVSIIIPYQNERVYIGDCLDSLEEQNCRDFEVIVVCDHSSGEAFETLRERVVSFPLTILELTEGHGVAAARNRGIRACQGEYILFLDCDDYLEKTAVRSLLERSEGQDIVCGRSRRTWYGRKVFYDNGAELDERNRIDSETAEEGEGELEPPEIREGDEEWEKVFCHLVRSNYMITGISVLGILFRREFILEKDLFFDEGYLYYTDLPYVVRAMCQTERVCEVRRVLYLKRKHNDPVHLPSLSQVRDDTTKRLEAVMAYLEIKEMIRGRDERVEISLDDKFIRYYVKKIAPFYVNHTSGEDVARIWELAAKCLEQLSPRSGRHAMRYSKRLIRYSRKHGPEEIARKVRRHSSFQTLSRVLRSRAACKRFLYRKLLVKLRIKENMVIFESFFGRSYSDSPKYIFEYLGRNHPGKFKCIWILNRKEKLPFQAKCVKRFGLRYFYYMARSQYFVFNGRQPRYFIKREGSVFLETWHGTPLKKLVFDMGEVTSASPMYKRDVYIQSRSWDYLIAPNQFSADIFRRCFMYDGILLRSGYPRNDILHLDEGGKRALAVDIREEMGIPEDKKVILYAPTWRDDEFYGSGRYKFTLKLDLSKLRQELGEEYIVVLRTHYFVVDSLDLDAYQGFAYNASTYHDIARLYLIADVLITDYSSVFFDFANLRRPMLFFTYDLEKYRGVLRGFYINIEEELPGPMLFTTEEIIAALRDLPGMEERYRERYRLFYDKYCGWEKGDASRKVAERVFRL